MFGPRREDREALREALTASRLALEKAARVDDKITSHEKICGERWNEARSAMQDVQNWQRKAMWGIVTLLFAVLGKILMDSFHFQIHLG